MGHSARAARALVSLALLLVTVWAASCGTGASPSPPSPRPAVSVSVLPDGVEPARVVSVFIRERTPAAQKLAMAQKIAQMREVEATAS